MQLEKFAAGSSPALPLSVICADADLARDVQGKLNVAGILDGPPDGHFGPVSEWALRAFCERVGLSLDGGFTRDIARRLSEVSNQNPLFVINFSAGDFASSVIKAMLRLGYWVAMHPACLNIVYVEGCDADGTPNGNVPNRFNDMRLLISIGGDGKPKMVGSWEGTTEPGRYWTITNLMNSKGAARIAFGQMKAWAVGVHNASKKSAHEALIQVAKFSVYRDLNKDFRREGDMPDDTGIFMINQHWGYDQPKDDLGKSSAGCLVGRTMAGHRKFMSLVKKDPRYLANHSYRFMTTIMPVSALTE